MGVPEGGCGLMLSVCVYTVMYLQFVYRLFLLLLLANFDVTLLCTCTERPYYKRIVLVRNMCSGFLVVYTCMHTIESAPGNKINHNSLVCVYFSPVGS